MRYYCFLYIGCFTLLFLSGAHGEFTNASGHDSQATLESAAIANANQGQDTIDAATTGDQISVATELDAIRLEVIEFRRLMVVVSGAFFGFLCMEYLFKWV